MPQSEGYCYCCQVTSVVSDSVRPHPWDSPGKNTGVVSRAGTLKCLPMGCPGNHGAASAKMHLPFILFLTGCILDVTLSLLFN